MRMHTDTLTADVIYQTLSAEKRAGRIAQSVGFKVMDEHASKSHARAFEIQLESWRQIPGDGRRAGNSGSYGAGEHFAATWDEWGWLIGALYKLDPLAVWGSTIAPQYADAEHFDAVTGLTYSPAKLIAEIEFDGLGDPYPWIVSSTGGRAGRQGFGRADHPGTWWSDLQIAEAMTRFERGEKQGNRGLKYLPRTVADVRAFARLAEEVAA